MPTLTLIYFYMKPKALQERNKLRIKKSKLRLFSPNAPLPSFRSKGKTKTSFRWNVALPKHCPITTSGCTSSTRRKAHFAAEETPINNLIMKNMDSQVG